MYVVNNSRFQVISSRFTRKSGYTNIKSSENIDYNKAIQLLNSFTPQGASPKMSIRIGSWENKIGLGYYQMEDEANARLSTILFKEEMDYSKRLRFPLSSDAIEDITNGNHQRILQQEKLEPLDIPQEFGMDEASMILYSVLSGDNMIIIHPEHENRVAFLKSIFNLIPAEIFHYNRITTGCAELDGNENIIGVEELPKKYRSHKKLYMPLDTIFVDLQEKQILGEGLKRNTFTQELIQLSIEKENKAKELLADYFKEISKPKFDNYEKYGENSRPMTEKIRSKIGLNEQQEDNWFLTF